MRFVEIENAVKKALEQFPVVKRSAKRAYQLLSYATSNEKIKSKGDISCVSPEDGFEYFYGYYDKSPWDASDRYMIALKVKQSYKSVAPKEEGTLVIFDTQNNNSIYRIGVTHAWNVQQGCMAQWMGPDFKSRIIYNDFRDGKYCSVICSLITMKEEKILPLPVYDVAHDGSFALSLDFSRLHRMRPGYGYSNLPETTKGELCPNKPCIWKMDILTGEVTELFTFTDLAIFEADESMYGAEHKVNHLMISPNGKRFMVLHRWFQKGRKHTRLVTVNVDKTEMYNLSDDIFVSHCYWKNDNEILSFLRKKEIGNHYYLMEDKTQEYKMYWPELNTDGHCSYSPEGKYIITDTYPNRKRIASVFLCTEEDSRSRCIARVFEPFKYDNDCRCDLHPRWNHAGDKICIDSVHEGKRSLYVIDLKQEIIKSKTPTFQKVVLVRSNKFKLIDKNIRDELFYVEDMFRPLNKIERIIKDVGIYFRRNIIKSYYNGNLKNSKANVIIVFDPHCRIQFLKWLRKNNPDKKIVLWFWNTIAEIGKNIPLEQIHESIEKWSYSKYDCEKYKFNYNTTFYPYTIKSSGSNFLYDVFFVGKDKGRLADILSIKDLLDNQGLTTYFHVSPTHQYELKKNSIYKPKIPYSEVDEYIAKSRCILDCEVSDSAGPTIRPLEALYRRKKLITNNKSLIMEDYYCKDNIFVIGINDISKIREFARSPYKELNETIYKKYTIHSWVERFL